MVVVMWRKRGIAISRVLASAVDPSGLISTQAPAADAVDQRHKIGPTNGAKWRRVLLSLCPESERPQKVRSG
jgi:hypothetical protein